MSATEPKAEDPIFKEPILGQFLGDETFPVTWSQELEKHLFWVYDDLHNPHPLSPMHEDIGLWTQSCDHMFRRFGTPFATDWIAKNVNGYLYTAAIPANSEFKIDGMELGARAGHGGAPRPRLRREDRNLPRRRAPHLRRGVRGLVVRSARPRDEDQLRLSRGHARQAGQAHPDGARLPARGRDRHARSPLEDPLDAQLRAALRDPQPAQRSWRRPTARSTRRCSAGFRTRPRTATGTRSKPCGR